MAEAGGEEGEYVVKWGVYLVKGGHTYHNLVKKEKKLNSVASSPCKENLITRDYKGYLGI